MKIQENHRAAYIRELTFQLADMARTDGLQLLAYILDMAALEAEHKTELKRCHDGKCG